jgi:hypothetical protein
MSVIPCGYAVFLFDNALEVLGDAVRPFLFDGPGGPRICCRAVDTGGAFLEMTLDGTDEAGEHVEVELIVPMGMVRMIVSTRGDASFGFRMRREGIATGLPVVGPGAPSPHAPSEAMPHTASGGGTARADDRRAPPEG